MRFCKKGDRLFEHQNVHKWTWGDLMLCICSDILNKLINSENTF